ncbi:MAG: ribonuclease D, partial [Gammaproteobacteria bacterium]|nr:ribonuclease D [Gammaproteobacteria bacterium]
MSLPSLIDQPDDLKKLCRQLRGQDFIVVDTEFIRERTYYPKLCLIQVAGPSIIACVDFLALDDLSPLTSLLLDPTITKVLHAARQDFEIFVQLT